MGEKCAWHATNHVPNLLDGSVPSVWRCSNTWASRCGEVPLLKARQRKQRTGVWLRGGPIAPLLFFPKSRPQERGENSGSPKPFRQKTENSYLSCALFSSACKDNFWVAYVLLPWEVKLTYNLWTSSMQEREKTTFFSLMALMSEETFILGGETIDSSNCCLNCVHPSVFRSIIQTEAALCTHHSKRKTWPFYLPHSMITEAKVIHGCKLTL